MLKESVKLYKRLLPNILPYWKQIALAFVCMLPLSFCTAGIAYLVKPALDEVFIKKDLKMLLIIPVAIMLLYTVKGVLEYFYNYLLGYTGSCIINDFRNRIYTHLSALSLSYFIKNPTGVLMSRITNDVNMVQRSVNTDVTNIFKEFFTFIWLIGVLLQRDFKLGCICLVVFPWAILPIMRFGKKSRKFSTRGQEKVGKIATFMHETITGCRIVKAFGMEEYENDRFSKENNRLLRIKLKRLKIRSLSAPTMELIGGIAGAGVIFYGGYNVLNGHATPGTFFSFVTALLLLYGPIRVISSAYQDIQEGLAAAKRVFEVLDTAPDVQERENAPALPAAQGAVNFNRVGFSYDGTPVLKNINLEVKPGEIIAIVGATGSGKTTLVNLIPRFFDPATGTISIDGRNIREYSLASLRSQIALVSQTAFLFNDTVLNNISYGDPSRDRESVVKAAKTAFAHEFIDDLPEGYDTLIGEQGLKLSGGQRQRIAIARAVLKDAPIIILDEATSSLDSRLEDEIQKSLDKLIQGRTTFIISHRLSTIKNAGRILVLSGGNIVEDGSHDELFSRGGEYARLYSIYLQDTQQQAAGG